MESAAAQLDFERAAAIRDTLILLQEAVQKRVRAAASPAMRREDAREGVTELGESLDLGTRPRVIEAYDVSSISGTYAVASMVCAVDGVPQRNRYRRFRIRTVDGVDDPAMLAEAVRRRFTRLQAEGRDLPDLVLADGGITQVRAARRALADLGLDGVPVAGLAKRFEEIYREELGGVVRLPRGSAALRVVQRIRDEAHRFALDYHRSLRQKRIRESELDSIPGVGPKRKAQLLRHFGSYRRLAKASEEELRALPGLGPRLAAEICQQLRQQVPPASVQVETRT
jgi:excinuclease ABC subunit C